MSNPLTRAGAFNRPVTILRRSTTKDAHNEDVEGWTPDAAPVLASVKVAPGTERFQSGETAAEAPMRFVLRWRPDPPTVFDRLRHDGRDYSISSVTEIGTREGIEVLAVARAE